MATSKPKTLEDLPKFRVTAVREGETSNDGYRSFELEGTFDPALESSFTQITKGTGVQWFWLLHGDRGYLSPMLKTFDKLAGTAVLICYEKDEPKVVGNESNSWEPMLSPKITRHRTSRLLKDGKSESGRSWNQQVKAEDRVATIRRRTRLCPSVLAIDWCRRHGAMSTVGYATLTSMQASSDIGTPMSGGCVSNVTSGMHCDMI